METPNKQFNWADYFSFKSMIALRIIQILYLLGAIGTTLGQFIMAGVVRIDDHLLPDEPNLE